MKTFIILVTASLLLLGFIALFYSYKFDTINKRLSTIEYKTKAPEHIDTLIDKITNDTIYQYWFK